jgi:MEMO1 family protein
MGVKALIICGAAVLLSLIASACLASRSGDAAAKVRPAAVAGGFYPTDPVELQKMVDGFLAAAKPPEITSPIIALVCPHAGYPYSGQVAAYSYALVKGKKYDRVVVIAPSHYEAFGFASVYNGDAYATPLGNVEIDKEFSSKLAGMSPLIKLSDEGHTPRGQGEHALEDQLPFLQRALGQFKLVAIVMGDQSYDSSRAVGVSLANMIAHDPGHSTLIVASSDLSHYHPYADAVTEDHKTLQAIEEWDYYNLSLNSERRIWEACGGAPIVAAMIAGERLGANEARVLKYANSGDVNGDKSRVVGYGAVAIYADSNQEKAKEEKFSLTHREEAALLKMARQSVETRVRDRSIAAVPVDEPSALQQDRGAFVTLMEKGELRGCIGYIAPMKSLIETVRDVAGYAALNDRRFPPVVANELPQLDYEVSVLSPLRHVQDVKQIQVGTHGLLIKKGPYEGVLLPQVPVEQGWNRATFLEEICRKAGLPPNAWRDEDADLFTFTAIVFGDHTLEPPNLDKPDAPRLPTLPGRPGQDLPHP